MASPEAFWQVVGAALGVSAEAARLVDRPVDQVVDEVALFVLVLDLQRLNPSFTTPDQLDLGDATLIDLCHYFVTMTPGHHTR